MTLIRKRALAKVLPLLAVLLFISACSVQNTNPQPRPDDDPGNAAALVRGYYDSVRAGNWNAVCALALPAQRNALGEYCENFIADLYASRTEFFRDPMIEASKATPVDQPVRKFSMPNDAVVSVNVEKGFIFGPEALSFPGGVDPVRVGLEVVKVDGRWFWVSGNSVS